MAELLVDLEKLPSTSALRKLNDIIKRARLAKVHALVVSHLVSKMPYFGKEAAKTKLIKNLDETYNHISHKHQIPLGDFPNIEDMKEKLKTQEWSKFPSLDKSLIKNLENMLARDVPMLMQLIQKEEPALSKSGPKLVNKADNIFDVNRDEGINRGQDDLTIWVPGEQMYEYRAIFENMPKSDNGKISGTVAKAEMLKSNLPNKILGKIWNLADIDKDGYLSLNEFALAKHLMKCVIEGSAKGLWTLT